MTGLPNRRTFETRLTDALAAPDPTHRVSLIFIDLDRFKTINDRLGHDAGDVLLRNVGDSAHRHDALHRLHRPTRAATSSPSSCPPSTHSNSPSSRNGSTSSFNFPHDTDDGEVVVTASIGLATHRKGETLDDFLRRADQLMYDAKRSGRDTIRTDT